MPTVASKTGLIPGVRSLSLTPDNFREDAGQWSGCFAALTLPLEGLSQDGIWLWYYSPKQINPGEQLAVLDRILGKGGNLNLRIRQGKRGKFFLRINTGRRTWIECAVFSGQKICKETRTGTREPAMPLHGRNYKAGWTLHHPDNAGRKGRGGRGGLQQGSNRGGSQRLSRTHCLGGNRCTRQPHHRRQNRYSPSVRQPGQ